MTPLLSTVLAATLICGPTDTPIARAAVSDSAYRQLFESGVTFAQFLAKAERRKEQWTRNYEQSVVPDALLARARGAGGTWKLLVVAVDGCSDSVNTVPYVARLVEKMMGVELRIVGSDVGRAVMDAHKTPDGRGATPTLVLLDQNYDERGCWIERPSELQSWITSQKGKISDDDIFSKKMKWYDDDHGSKTLEEVVAMIEAAARGSTSCGSSSPD
jgi:hypothetical protein